MEKRQFGTTNRGEEASLYLLENKNGMKAAITDFGAIIVSLCVKDKDGNYRDVVLGYDKASDYQVNTFYFGACIGRNGNRIADSKIVLDGQEYDLEVNDNENNLHSGTNGVHDYVWNVDSYEEDKIVLSIVSKDKEQGFPGNMTIKVTYTLTDENALQIDYEAVSDKKTVANLTNHSYFNLDGHASGPILGQKLKVCSSNLTPVVNSHAIPTGELMPVAGTPFDFLTFTKIGDRIEDADEQMIFGGGYDHNYALDKTGHEMCLAAAAKAAESGIEMEVYTDCVGMQFYSGNFIKPHTGKGGASYDKRHGFCLETQYFPNAVNEPKFESPVIEAGEVYRSTTAYKFS